MLSQDHFQQVTLALTKNGPFKMRIKVILGKLGFVFDIEESKLTLQNQGNCRVPSPKEHWGIHTVPRSLAYISRPISNLSRRCQLSSRLMKQDAPFE